MKKIFAFAVLAMTVLSCNKEIAEQQPVPAGDAQYTTILATNEDLTKVALDFSSASNLTWVDTDGITVYDGTEPNLFTIKSGTNTGTSAVFEGSCNTAASMLYAVYPYGAYKSAVSDGIKVRIPNEQTVPNDGVSFVDPAALISVAYAAPGSNMTFKQVCGLVKISVPDSDIQEITIHGKAIAGIATAKADGTLEYSDALFQDDITLTHASGYFTPGDYYVAVMPGTTPAGGFTISYKTPGFTASKTASSQVVLERAKGVNAGSLTGYTKSIVIKTMDQLFSWNDSRVATDPWDVTIGADIDMENEPWTPKDFKGTFDGKGHKLYNINVQRNSNACFINSLTGTLKDIVFGSSDDKTYDGKSAFIQNNPEDGNTWRYVGLVTRLQADAVMENVTSYVNVEVASTSVSKTRIGGLVGVIAGANTVMKNCHNYGNVSNLASTAQAACNIGGVVGRMDVAMTMEGVYNHGTITCKNPKVVQLGGIVSGVQAGASLKNCFNYGTISYEVNALTGVTYIGGMAGYSTISEGAVATLDNCANYGPVTVSSANGGSNLYFGGVLGYSRLSTLKGCDNYADLSSNHGQVARIGGVIGTVHNATELKSSCNMGKIQFVQENEVDAWQGIGGIVGFAEGSTTPTIESCYSYGNITAEFNSTGGTYSRCCVGGIVGMPFRKTVIKNNENDASIQVTNKCASALRCCAGGVIGQDEGANGPSEYSGNINRGTISGTGDNICVGGLYGYISVATSISGDKCFGKVSGKNAGAVVSCNSASIAATICDAVTVNGEKRTEASNESKWLCPNNTGTILPIFVAHSDSE